MSKYPYVEVNIYEDTVYPVVMHRFFGKTIEEARGYAKSHMKTDSFMRSAMNTGRFKGIKVKVGVSEVLGE